MTKTKVIFVPVVMLIIFQIILLILEIDAIMDNKPAIAVTLMVGVVLLSGQIIIVEKLK